MLQAQRIHDKARLSWYAETKGAPFTTRAKGALLTWAQAISELYTGYLQP